MFNSGLASPVTLAPKSARPLGPNELPPDLVAALMSSTNGMNEQPVDIDLTIGEGESASKTESKMNEAGSSADKPIELDLDNMDLDMGDMSDLFGDSAESPSANSADKDAIADIFSSNRVGQISESNVDNAKAGDFLGGNTTDIFASLGMDSDTHGATKEETSAAQAAPSPNTLLASFDPTNNTIDSFPQTGDNPTAAGFDIGSIDFGNLDPNFFNNGSDPDTKFSMDMDQFLTIDGGSGKEESVVKQEGGS
jgi:hypothetical protein